MNSILKQTLEELDFMKSESEEGPSILYEAVIELFSIVERQQEQIQGLVKLTVSQKQINENNEKISNLQLKLTGKVDDRVDILMKALGLKK